MTAEGLEVFRVNEVSDDFDEQKEEPDASQDGETERENWGGQFEFVLSLVGYTVGLGNIWRFPYFCFRNGGGIAIVPFLIFLVTCGGPLYYIEVCLGQFSGKTPITVWNICPLFRGIGFVMVICSLIYIWFFGSAFGWVFYFLIQSFYPTLPWSHCGNEWNTRYCIDSNSNKTENFKNLSQETENQSVRFQSSGAEYWETNVLHKSTGIHELGNLQPHLVGCLLLGWFLVFLCLAKGVKSLGKVVYATATLPYVLLTVLMIRGVTLDGAWIGLKHYFIPDFSQLARGQLWMEAAVQCFYSLGPAWGPVITMASFNKFHHNALRDTLIVCVADAFTAIYSGIVVFAVLGFLSQETGTPLRDLPFSGPGLAFIAYPEALSRLPAPNVWSVLFFLTLALVGIDTQFAAFETCSTSIIDLNRKTLHRYNLMISAGLTAFLFLMGMVIATSGGYYIFMLADWYVATFNVVATAFLEIIIVAWIYGTNRFAKDIETMRGYRPSILIRIIWCFVIPSFIGGILITAGLAYSSPTIGYVYPDYAIVLGNFIAFGPLSMVPVVALYKCIKAKGNIKMLLQPDASWLPHDRKQRNLYRLSPYTCQRGLKRKFCVDILGLAE